VRRLIAAVLAEGREWLTEPEAKAVCAAYSIPVVATRTVPTSAEAAAQEAARIGFPVVLKILSPDITHKSDVGGVALNLQDTDDVRAAAQAMLARIAKSHPQARLDGLSVQTMVRAAGARADHRRQRGPDVWPRHPVRPGRHGGGGDEGQRHGAAAAQRPLARALIGHTRVARLLAGWRDVPPADMSAVVATLMAVSQLLADVPEVAELDINPCWSTTPAPSRWMPACASARASRRARPASPSRPTRPS
jgi:acetyltransferase